MQFPERLVVIVIVMTIAIILALGYCVAYVIFDLRDYSEYKNFDLTKMEMKIEELNNGEFALTKDGEIVQRDGGLCVSKDTCRLKYHAYELWSEQIKK